MTLLILAAGLGSRFGGLKQIEPVGPNGEYIIDYSVKDAKKAGFDKVVFVIKRDMLDYFEETIGKRIRNTIEVGYAFQEINDVNLNINFNRTKPWGTVQAILSARNLVDDKFAVINSDDFYGYDAFKQAVELLGTLNNVNEYGAILFQAKNTLSANGNVKRGICFTEGDEITNIIESQVHMENNVVVCEPLNGDRTFEMDISCLVSMNMFLFNSSVFDILENAFEKFLKNCKDNNSECLISDVINERIQNKEIHVKYLETNSKWYGITFKEDLVLLKEGINKLISEGKYMNN